MQRYLIIASAVLVLVASGVVHGVWTDRWSAQTDLDEAARRMEQLPMTIGNWHGSNVEVENVASSGLAGMIARRYVNAANSKSVTILLACGRSRAVCTHTPDVCYAGSGFEVEKPQRYRLKTSASGLTPEFWTARFVRERESSKTHLRIFWTWNVAGAWRIAEEPRLSFAGEKLLHKLYVMREMVQPDEPIDGDACVEFMHDLLPAVVAIRE